MKIEIIVKDELSSIPNLEEQIAEFFNECFGYNSCYSVDIQNNQEVKK